ncbi:TPA: hypothetical protein NO485_005011 [Klebsiella pneumoniae]|nr:hypothetical protein [Klebsiella pneumoniae]HCI6686763.1 hypothetical protein [Klebsiella pneumoniae]
MTDITELAQRVERIISDVKLKHGGNDTYAPIMKWDEFSALVEALEKAQQRIDELDSRTVKLPKLKMLEDYLAEVAIEERKQILVGVKLEFHRALAAAGIKMEAE